MPKEPFHRSRKDPALPKLKPHSNKATPLRLPPTSTERYTQAELEDIIRIRRQRYDDLLECARSGDMSSHLVFPSADRFEAPMPKVCPPLSVKIEFLDIYHYLQARQADIRQKVSYNNFGSLIGCHLPSSTLCRMLKEEDKLRAASKIFPDGAHYIVNRKNVTLEQVLYRWLNDQRKQDILVNDKMIKQAAAVTYTILADYHDPNDDRQGIVPSFSVSWFDASKKRHQISYCQLHGEAGSVDMEAIEPELAEIRELCVQYTPDNIFNCNETRLYLKELDTKSYTALQSTSGAKANRNCRVSILFCINASGSSLALADTVDALKPLVIAKKFVRGVDEDSADRMVMKTTGSGWMIHDVFMEWLQSLDDHLTEPALLLLDSCPAHNNIDMRDAVNNIPWKYLRIQRLPKNSTSRTQPLDAGVVSVFKRAFLEMLSQETHLIRNYDKQTSIFNGHAWTLVPYAWNRLKAQTLRNCFANTPVLPEEMRWQLRRRSPTFVERKEALQHSRHNQYKEQERVYFEHLIAETGIDDNWTIRAIGNKDVQE